MKIKNVSNSIVNFSDLAGSQGGQGLTLQPGAEIVIYDEDAEKSSQLSSLMTAGVISKMSDEEPNDSGAASDVSGSLLKEWVLLNDVYAQFAGGVDGINGVFSPNSYTGPKGGVEVEVQVTNGQGVRDILNNVTTVVLTATPGTATGVKINGVAGPVTLTMVQGRVTATISATGAGGLSLGLSAPTHPSVTLATDAATVTLA